MRFRSVMRTCYCFKDWGLHFEKVRSQTEFADYSNFNRIGSIHVNWSCWYVKTLGIHLGAWGLCAWGLDATYVVKTQGKCSIYVHSCTTYYYQIVEKHIVSVTVLRAV